MGDKVKVSYDLPRFDDWQAGPDPEWRLQLDADAYVSAAPVGRDVFLSGRVSWRTIPGRPDAEGWHHGGNHLYRVDAHGLGFAGTREPTTKMMDTVRDTIELEPPSDELRLKTVRTIIKRRLETAKDTYKQEVRDLNAHAERFATSIVADLSDVYPEGGVTP